ncbi:DNA polymerase delta, subunit 4-domain-containing protein [Tricharina praecox]|uniref:DNA polymerase delta, subunit 4-domain-containing protein n=1 Tax=Tricharina praecox TaxID=43433 RepID=UPI00221F301B|nr:DNA polymerase delta, subunit 4-domain-containing protein [Tricharina praecox]KAI5847421.1 DNA polymerase delta, subunit 4-domain-containing protein [Tricharina praecox]
MAPPRRTTARQATLSFKSKVTKPTLSKDKDKKGSTAAMAISFSDDSQDSQQDSQESQPSAPPSQKQLLQEAQQAAAAEISKDAVQMYYYELRESRLCTPYHQDSLTLEEKILRHFDLSMQYGPAIGITRLNRWKRAHRMGFSPPIEVLAVALQMEDEALAKDADLQRGMRDTRRAYMDDFLSSRCAGE